MDDLLIKTSTVRDGVSPAPATREGLGGFAGLAVSFQDLLHKAGVRLENGFFAIVDRAGIGAAHERTEPAASADDDYRRQPDDGKDRFEARDRADDNRSDQSRSRPVHRENDSGRDHGAEHRDARDDSSDADRGDSHADDYAGDHADKSAADDKATTNDDSGTDGKVSSGDGDEKPGAQSNQSDGDAKAAGDKSGNQGGKAAVANTEAAVAQAGVAQQLLNPLVAGLLVAGDAKGATKGRANAVENVSATGTDKMAQTAVENIAKVTPVSTGKNDGPQNNHQGNGQALANAANQAKAQAAEQSAVKVEADIAGGAKPAEIQAASLAKVLGDGNKTQVSVTVDNEAQTLMSRPTASLTAGAALMKDGAGPSSGQNANAGVHSGTHNPVVAQQVAQSQTGPAQNQGPQNSQTLATTQAGTDAKGLVQATTSSGNSGGTAHSGGGEAGVPTNAGATTASQQAQQAQQQAHAGQAQNADRQQRPGHSVVEQVFVKITKAIKAGNDRITIQLRPANMGRVEVKMELTHDNRLMAVVTADNKDTLEMLQRDARDLQRALADAGLHTDNGDLNFNLRGQTGQGDDGDGKSPGKLFAEDDVLDGKDAPADPAFAHRDGIYVNGRIDVRA